MQAFHRTFILSVQAHLSFLFPLFLLTLMSESDYFSRSLLTMDRSNLEYDEEYDEECQFNHTDGHEDGYEEDEEDNKKDEDWTPPSPSPPRLTTKHQPAHSSNKSQSLERTLFSSSNSDISSSHSQVRQEETGQVNPNSNKKPHPDGAACVECGTTASGTWRKGPHGPRTLCSSCGSKSKVYTDCKTIHLTLEKCGGSNNKGKENPRANSPLAPLLEPWTSPRRVVIRICRKKPASVGPGRPYPQKEATSGRRCHVARQGWTAP